MICFVAGTKVKTNLGFKNIEDVGLGESVLSRDEITGQLGYKRVVRLFCSKARALTHLKYRIHEGQEHKNESLGIQAELIGTPEHPFWSVTLKKWVPMGCLSTGELLLLADGTSAVVESIEHRRSPKGLGEDVYNFEVEQWHTYFVAPRANGVVSLAIWVHNTCPYFVRINPQFPGRPDPEWSIDTQSFVAGPKSTLTSKGFLRDHTQFWPRWQELKPGSLSKGNRWKIENGFAPVVDDDWIKHFPEHEPYFGDKLIHHHVDHGRYAIPVPAPTHPGSGGPFHGFPLQE